MFNFRECRPDKLLHNFEFEVEFLTTQNTREVELPKLSREPPRRPALIEIDNKLDAQRTPEIGEAHVRRQRFQLRARVKRKRRA